MNKILFILLFYTQIIEAKVYSYVTVLPQKYFLEQIAGDKVSVRALKPINQRLDSYKLSAKQRKTFEKYTDVYFISGLQWEKDHEIKIKQINSALNIIPINSFEDNIDGSRWLNPLYVKKVADTIYAKLIELDPKNKIFYKYNYERFLDKLDQLYILIKHQLSDNRTNGFFVFDDSFNYFSEQFTLQPKRLKLDKPYLTTQEIIKLKKYVKKHNIKTILILNSQFIQEAKVVSKALNITITNINIYSYNWMSNIYNLVNSLTK
ncbi:MAG: zinc ABC transporter substrate-binding protein [Campylobacterota bacterium]|nr:zinc ABC transporter substrate-binding protein [Campylobacterota bacterium]